MGLLYSQLFITPPFPLHCFAGQTVVVTGTNIGLGLEAARHIAANNASKVILAVRNLKAGEAAKSDIEKTAKCSSDVVEVWHLDLSSYDSVKAFGIRVDRLPRLDVCVMNAGKSTAKFSLAEGHESTITTNVISTFLLSLLVLPKMKGTRVKNPDMARPTLVIVSSEVHRWADMPERNSKAGIFKALDQGENMNKRYSVSKLLDVLGTRALAERVSKDKEGKPLVIVNTVNPGFCYSALGREQGWAFRLLQLALARKTEEGSRTLVHAAAAGNIGHGRKVDRVDGGMETHGKYLSDALIEEPGDMVTGKGNIKGLKGTELQEKVWAELREIMQEIVPGVAKNV